MRTPTRSVLDLGTATMAEQCNRIDQIRPQSVRSTANRDRLGSNPMDLHRATKISLHPSAGRTNRGGEWRSSPCKPPCLRRFLRRRSPGAPPRASSSPAWSPAARGGRSPERTRDRLFFSLLGRRLEDCPLPRGRASAILHFLSPRIHFARPVCMVDWR